MADGPRSDFGRQCAAAEPRNYAGAYMLDAACTLPGQDDYKKLVNRVGELYRRIMPTLGAMDDAGSLSGPAAQLAALEVQQDVNSRLTYATDMQMHGKPDVWQTPAQTLQTRQGDCEDFALLKMAMLAQQGFAADKMWLAVGSLVNSPILNGRSETHATLVVELNDKPYVLDSLYKPQEGGSLVPLGEYYKATGFTPWVLLNHNSALSQMPEALREALRPQVEGLAKKEPGLPASPLKKMEMTGIK